MDLDTTDLFSGCTRVEHGVTAAIGAAMALGEIQARSGTSQRAKANELAGRLATWLQARGIED